MRRAIPAVLALVLVASGFTYAAAAVPKKAEPAAPTSPSVSDEAGGPSASKRADAETRRQERLEARRRARKLAQVRRTLRARPRDFTVESAALPEVLKLLGQAGKFSIAFDPELEQSGIDLSTRTVTMNLASMTYEQALYILLPREVGYRIGPGYVLITTLEKSWLPLRPAIYSVRITLAEVPNFKGPRFEVGDVTSQSAEGGGLDFFKDIGSEDAEDEGRATPDRLIELVKKFVRHDNDRRIAPWDDEGGPATVQYLDGKLIISQTDHGHRAVAKLLRLIR